MSVKASDFKKRKKEDVFAEGYFINCASDVTPGSAQTEEVIHIYGQDAGLIDMRVDNGTLSLTNFEKGSGNILLNVLTENDPDDTTTKKKFTWEEVRETTIWVNKRDDNNANYTHSWYLKNWKPAPGFLAGAPNDRGQRTIAGNCEVPVEYNCGIIGEKFASGAATLTYVPKLVPRSTNIYAIRIVAIYDPGTGEWNYETQDLTVTAGMVDSAGVITFGAIVTAATELSSVTHAYINYLYTGSGIQPNITQNGFYE